MMTRFYCIRLEPSQRFAAGKKAVRTAFAELPLDFVSFGQFSRGHRWDHRLLHPPRLEGPIVAALTVSPSGELHMSLYPMAVAWYDDAARAEFGTVVLARLREWAIDRLHKPATSPEGYEECVVVWTGSEHTLHMVRFQTGLELV